MVKKPEEKAKELTLEERVSQLEKLMVDASTSNISIIKSVDNMNASNERMLFNLSRLVTYAVIGDNKVKIIRADNFDKIVNEATPNMAILEKAMRKRAEKAAKQAMKEDGERKIKEGLKEASEQISKAKKNRG